MAQPNLDPTSILPPTSPVHSKAKPAEPFVDLQGSTISRPGQTPPKPTTGEETNVLSHGQLGRYRLDEMLGKGGFGEVWRAFDPDLQRTVAIKFPRADRKWSRRFTEALVDEARRVAGLKIPGIAPVYDVGIEDERLFVVFQFLEGGTLAEQMRRQKFTAEEAARMVAEIAETLHQAHLHDLVHRDIKPANILLDAQGRPFVADFGLAITEREQLRESGETLGTYAYMSPEQAAGESNRVDARADVYSLGVILYQLLTGRLPFLANSPAEYIEQVVNREPRPPRTINENIPRALEQICLKSLAKKVVDRYSTAADLAHDLRAWLAPATPQAPRVARSLVAATALALVCLASWGVYTAMSGLGRDAPSKEPAAPAARVPPEPSGHPVSPGVDTPKIEPESKFPLELDFPGRRRGTSRFVLEPGSRSYLLTTEQGTAQLVQFGEMSADECTLEMEMSQVLPWSSLVGFFFGYREETRNNQKKWAVFEAVFLDENRSPKKPSGLRLSHWGMSAHPQSGTLTSEHNYGYIDVPYPNDARPRRLKVRLEKGRVQAVWWDGSLREEFAPADQRVRELGDEIPSGPWGVVNASGTTTIRILEPAIGRE